LGLEISRDHFEEHEFAEFAERLRQNLAALSELLSRKGFGVGATTLGAELEMSLVGEGGRPSGVNQAVLAKLADPSFTVELNRFNLECNSRPVALAGRPFAALQHEFDENLARVRRAAKAYGARVALIGILPTLTPADLERSAMTDLPRYRALSTRIRELRGKPFRLRIEGEDRLDIECDDVTYEGANTSLQLHLRAAPGDFVALYNAIQLATLPALAIASNSPTFLGHRLWDETRIALFKKAVDDRQLSRGPLRGVPRVSYGLGWLAGGALDLFRESVELHDPLLPVLSDEQPLQVVRAGGVPQLAELRLHNGTVWRWNRAIYDPSEGGHLRIEMRALPSGPSVIDMLANAAFLIGTALELATRALPAGRLSFEAAHGSFYRAARNGLAAELLWPSGRGLVTVSARELVLALIPVAQRGLVNAGVDATESGRLLEVIRARAESGQTASVWQRKRLAALEATRTRQAALVHMLDEYLDKSESGVPVHEW